MSIQDLIDSALPGGIVNLPAGIYNEQLVIEKPLTLQGPLDEAAGIAIVDGAGLSSLPTIQILSSDVIVKRLTIIDGPTHGIQVGSDMATNLNNVVISGNIIRGHGNAGIITNYGASMTIDHNIIEGNGIGAGFNRGGIILYPHGATSITDNTVAGNTVEGIFARASGAGLVIEGNLIENHSNSGITLAWDQQNTSIVNNRIKDCGEGSFEEQGGIVIIQSMAETIRGNSIENCMHSGIFWGWTPTSGNPPDEILIVNNQINNSSRDAIYLFSQGSGGFIPPDLFPLEPKIKENVLSNSSRAGVYISNAYYYGPGSANPIINSNEIVDNVWGVFNATAHTVDAIGNWWGSNSGPFHPDLNPHGTGNPVSDRVDFMPWLTELVSLRIVKCLIQDVSLEKYNISKMGDEASKVILTIKVTGDVVVNANGEETTLGFEKWFIQSFVIQLPELNKCEPAIAYSARCCATLSSNAIEIEVDLCIVASIRGKHHILVPSFGIHPLSQNLNESLSKVQPDTMKTNIIECIRAERVFSTCWFRKTLFHSIALSRFAEH